MKVTTEKKGVALSIYTESEDYCATVDDLTEMFVAAMLARTYNREALGYALKLAADVLES